MSLAKYEVFNTIVEVGSLTKAAEKLNLTQSGVSHAISGLEAEFGFTLLTRDRAGINLTSNGQRVLEYIREILQQNEKLKQEVAAINGLEVGTVRVGTFASISTQWLPQIIKKFQNSFGSIEIKLLEGDYDDVDHWISTGTVDFGFVSLPTVKSFEVIPLKKDRLLCILPEEHPLTDERFISFEQIKDEPFIIPKWGYDSDVLRILKEHGITPKVKYEVEGNQTIIAMVQNGLGISIIPEMVLSWVPQNVRVVNLEGQHYRSIGIAAHSLNKLSPAANKFKQCIQGWLADENLLDF